MQQSNARANLVGVARKAGVHPSTASRALSDNPVRVSPATVERVRKIAAELGYHRDVIGAGLRTGHSRMIGVLLPRLTDLVMASIYEAIDEYAMRAGYNAVVANTQDDPNFQRVRLNALLSRRVDALIIGDSREGSLVPGQLSAQHIPFVLVMRRIDGYPCVSVDDIEGGRLAAEHLLELGHERVAVIAGDPETSTGADRTRGFVMAFSQAGVDIPVDQIVTSGFDVASGRRATEKMMALDPPPSAIFAVNDFTAFGAMGAIRDAGRRVGSDIALVGYNDVPIAAELAVPLTTIRSPLRDMGRISLDSVLRQIEGHTVDSVLLHPTLVKRASTLGPPASG